MDEKFKGLINLGILVAIMGIILSFLVNFFFIFSLTYMLIWTSICLYC